MRNYFAKNRYTEMLLILLAVVLIFFSAAQGAKFWRADMLRGMCMQFPEFGMITLGLMFCFISGNIDMSFIALGDFAAIIAVRYIVGHTDDTMSNGAVGAVILTGILISVCIGIFGGFINGVLIAFLGIPPVMATIAMSLVWKGFSTALTRGDAVTGLPMLYSDIGHSDVLGFIPFPLFIFIIGFLIALFLIKRTTYGEKLYMIGTNPKAAAFSAINTKLLIIVTFIICAVYSNLGCMIMVSTMSSAKADYGSSYLMRCILILVLAGVLPDGGYGKITDVILAIIIVQIISSGVNMFPQLNTYYASLIWGGLLLIVLIISTGMTGEGLLKRLKRAKS
ncbi:MAG TPA: hypothetical protein DCL38_07880 [Lachnospiraceae bacterium]|nr:hypothetical protein [Lachnospiraceae bacterium]